MDNSNKTNPPPNQRIWAVGGGKGGVGKSLFSTNLAVILTELGHNVIAIDLDLGNANMHTALGVRYPRWTLIDFLNGKAKNLHEILLDTSLFNLKFISGAGGIIGSANMWHTQKLKLMRYIEKLHADHIVLDLGAGTSYNTIDFFISATDHVIVTTPESPSIQSAFNFIRISIFRKLHSLFSHSKQAIELINNSKAPAADGSIIKMKEVVEALGKIDPENTQRYLDFKRDFKPYIVLNMILRNDEVKLGNGIEEVIKRYLDVNAEFAGSISFDNIIRESVEAEMPYIIKAPKSRPTNELISIIPKLLGNSSNAAGMKDIIQREVRNTSKDYGTRVIESSNKSVDPSIYVRDKVNKVDNDKSETSGGFFNFKPNTWSKIAIDLGTSNTRIFIKDRGIVLNEPSTAASFAFPAIWTLIPDRSSIAVSRPVSNEPPPVNVIPRSTRSPDNSGGTFSSRRITTSIISFTGLLIAARISVVLIVFVFGILCSTSCPRISKRLSLLIL